MKSARDGAQEPFCFFIFPHNKSYKSTIGFYLCCYRLQVQDKIQSKSSGLKACQMPMTHTGCFHTFETSFHSCISLPSFISHFAVGKPQMSPMPPDARQVRVTERHEGVIC